jgi:hypothetical protein
MNTAVAKPIPCYLVYSGAGLIAIKKPVALQGDLTSRAARQPPSQLICCDAQ